MIRKTQKSLSALINSINLAVKIEKFFQNGRLRFYFEIVEVYTYI